MYYFDHDSHLDLRRLEVILSSRARDVLQEQWRLGLGPGAGNVGVDDDGASDTKAVEAMVTGALGLVAVVRCASTFEYAAALEVLIDDLRGASKLG